MLCVKFVYVYKILEYNAGRLHKNTIEFLKFLQLHVSCKKFEIKSKFIFVFVFIRLHLTSERKKYKKDK